MADEMRLVLGLLAVGACGYCLGRALRAWQERRR